MPSRLPCGSNSDDLAESFQRLQISEELKVHEDRKRVLVSFLEDQILGRRTPHLISPAHKCFEPALLFCIKWDVKLAAWGNFVRLLSGYEHFPLLLLQNPARSHHKAYEEMIKCSTFQWISKTLEAIGLDMDDTPILDICSFFSDEDLANMDDRKMAEVIQASYILAEDIISLIRPKAVVSCQCATLGVWDQDNKMVWPAAQNQFLQDLCSRVSWAENGKATEIIHGALQFWSFWGFHPRWHGFGERKAREQVLVRLFQDVYMPCSTWKKDVRPKLLMDELVLAMCDFVKVLEDHQAAMKVEINNFLQFENEMRERVKSTRP